MMSQSQNLFTSDESVLLLAIIRGHVSMIESLLRELPVDSKDKIKKYYHFERYKAILSKLEDSNA